MKYDSHVKKYHSFLRLNRRQTFDIDQIVVFLLFITSIFTFGMLVGYASAILDFFDAITTQENDPLKCFAFDILFCRTP